MVDFLTRRDVLSGAASLIVLSACAKPPPKEPTPPKGFTRYIRKGDERILTISLWAGALDQASPDEWPTVSTVTGKNRNRIIRGPQDWLNPRTGENLQVYERVKEGKSRTKRQLLTVTNGGQGLGRVLDQRTNSPDRYFENDLIFPLGVWRAGEERRFQSVEHTVAGPAKRMIILKIRRLDFRYKGAEHSLRYDWTSHDAAGRVLFSERYVYTPGRSLVRFRNRSKTREPTASG